MKDNKKHWEAGKDYGVYPKDEVMDSKDEARSIVYDHSFESAEGKEDWRIPKEHYENLMIDITQALESRDKRISELEMLKDHPHPRELRLETEIQSLRSKLADREADTVKLCLKLEKAKGVLDDCGEHGDNCSWK